MPDRQRFCVTVLSLIILGSAAYLGYYIFIDSSRAQIDRFNWLRMSVFFFQHAIALAMLIRLLYYEEHDNLIQWMFELSLIIILTFIAGEVLVSIKGGRLFGTIYFFYSSQNDNDNNNDNTHTASSYTRDFQLNEITLYYQIMTDFVMFFIVSTIALIVIKCKKLEQEHRYEFMIDNLKSEDFVDEPNVHDKKTCAICLTDLANQRVLKVPCDHIFHKQCLVNWLKRSSICPLCRTDIQQSLGPDSPLRANSSLRAVSNNNIPQYPPIQAPIQNNIQQPRIAQVHQLRQQSQSRRQQQGQQSPELTFSQNTQNRPGFNINACNNSNSNSRSNLNTNNNRSSNMIGRVNEQVSLGNSRVSIGRVIKQKEELKERKNTLNNKFTHQIEHEREKIKNDNNKNSPIISEYTFTPRSIHLPTPLASQQNFESYQNNLKNQNNKTLPHPSVRVQHHLNQKAHKQQIMNPSQQYVANPLYKKIYSNPNQNYPQTPIFRQTHVNQRYCIN